MLADAEGVRPSEAVGPRTVGGQSPRRAACLPAEPSHLVAQGASEQVLTRGKLPRASKITAKILIATQVYLPNSGCGERYSPGQGAVGAERGTVCVATPDTVRLRRHRERGGRGQAEGRPGAAGQPGVGLALVWLGCLIGSAQQ